MFFLLCDGICPTRVGMNRKQTYMAQESGHLPHTRGDEPKKTMLPEGEVVSAPHAWG